ncbi:S-layer homology domain-containing protein [Paenibacillus sp. 2TAB19]|uniref:S-layer homology domain-containing protein n=1 Tax=Paenibacillus sp. 2TAB19 TaxID=3233003 RepID=UPI003F985FF8
MNIITKESRKTLIIAFVLTLLGVELLSGFGPNPLVQAADGTASVIVEDFEDGISDVKFNPKRMYEATLHLEDNAKYVRNGQYSARIDYDMIGIVDNPSQIEVGYQSYMPVTGYPIKVGMWVYGNNEGHLLTTKFREQGGSGSSFQSEFYDAATNGINWTGWKYIEADVPQGKTGPIVLELFFQLKQSDMSKKNKGSIWVDDIRFIYEEADEDHDVPVIKPIAPVENAELTAPLDQLKVEMLDAETGLDMDTLSVYLDGTDITADVQYASDSHLLTYPGERIDGGYHVLAIQVKDNNGNPAEKTYAFTMNAGERLFMKASEEAVSNEIYAVNVNIKDYANAETAQFELNYDPNTLQVENVDAVNGVTQTSDIDNENGIVQVNLDGLSAAVADDIATVNFRVNSEAVLARGEAYKSITMSGSELASGGVQTSSPLATPIRYTIAFPFHLEMTGVGIGTTTTFTVTDRNHQPYEGADIYFTGLLKQSSVVTIDAATTNVYEDDDASSEVLMVATAGQRYYASGEADDGWFEVIFADGQTTGYIAEADVSSQPLEGSLGQTDAEGQLTSDLTTLALGTYQVQAVFGDQNSKVVDYEVVEQYGMNAPEFIQTYVAEDMSTQLSAAWQTNSATKDTFIQYIAASDWGTEEEPNASYVKQQQSESELQVLSMKEKGTKGEIRFHNVRVEGLKANTAYKYRVGYDGHWSAWYAYSTLDQNKATPTSFLYVTDSHTKEDDGLEIYQELMTNAFAQYPSTQFVMHGGDMVDVGGALEEWMQFWKASSIYATTYPSALTLGNHDVKGEGKDVFTKGANFPENGPESQMQYAYAYDIDDTHFVVLNSEGTEEQMMDQAAWLQEDLDKNDNKWTIAMFHRPAYHTEEGRDTLVEYTQTYFAPILEKMKVDLVLVGHDHVYARTYPMQDGKPNKSTNKGTVYLDGGAAGWKFYDGIKYDYLNHIFDEDVPVYSAIKITQNEIRVEARTSAGDLIDEFSITKPKTGGPSVPGPIDEPSPEPTLEPTPTADKVISDKEVTAAIQSGRLVIDLSSDGGTIQIPTELASLIKQLENGEIVITVPNQPNIVISGQELNRLFSDNSDAESVEITVEYATPAEQQAYVEQIQSSKKTASAASKAFTVTATSSAATAALSYTLGMQADGMSAYTNLYEKGSDGKLTLVQANVALYANRLALLAGHTYVAIEVVTNYSDMNRNHWAYDYIQMLSAANLAAGVDAERFAPNASITRAEFTAIIARALQLSATGEGQFNDVDDDAWYADAVIAAAEKGIIYGQNNEQFNPHAQISRQEMAVILNRAYAYMNGKNTGNTSTASFTDMNNAQSWAIEAIANVERLGLVRGGGNGKFNPQSSLTRAEAATVIAKLLSL